MKQYFYKILLSVACLFIFNTAQAQYFISSHSTKDSCLSQGNNVEMWLGVNQANTNLSFTTYFGDGTSANGSIMQTFGTIWHTYTLPGTYTVYHVLKLSGVPVDTVQFSITISMCKYVWIQVYNDLNTNCTKDIGDPYIFTPVSVEIDSAGHKDTVTVYGNMSVIVHQGMPYTFKMLTTPLGTSTTCPSSGIITQTIPTTSMPIYIDFGVQCGSSSAFDLMVTKVQGRYRPVNFSYVDVWTANSSCVAKSGTVTATFSSKFNYSTAWPTPTSVSGNTVTWNYSNMTSSTVGHYTIRLTPAVTLSLGDTICATASITPTSGDAVTANNTLNSCDSVVTSFDPNEKEVSPAGAILSGTQLSYTLHFENLGNDTAFNIYILDTLSNHLDVNSFEMVSSSHGVMTSKIAAMNGDNILRFDFNDIHLPHPASSDQNKGWVKFNINTKSGLPQLTQIPNRAGIYFDINPVILTNTVTNWIAPINIDEVVRVRQYAVYPNPVTETFTIRTDKGVYNEVKIMNTIGQVCGRHQLAGEETIIDASKLSPGIYFLLMSGDNGNVVERIEKQ